MEEEERRRKFWGDIREEVYKSAPPELEKMEYDHYPNLIMLSTGKWFIADGIETYGRINDDYFVSFSFSGCNYDYLYEYNLKREDDLTGLHSCMRNICVKLSHIVAVVEFDS